MSLEKTFTFFFLTYTYTHIRTHSLIPHTQSYLPKIVSSLIYRSPGGMPQTYTHTHARTNVHRLYVCMYVSLVARVHQNATCSLVHLFAPNLSAGMWRRLLPALPPPTLSRQNNPTGTPLSTSRQNPALNSSQTLSMDYTHFYLTLTPFLPLPSLTYSNILTFIFIFITQKVLFVDYKSGFIGIYEAKVRFSIQELVC